MGRRGGGGGGGGEGSGPKAPKGAVPGWLAGHAMPLFAGCFPPWRLPRGAGDFPGGGNHSGYMPPLTYLA